MKKIILACCLSVISLAAKADTISTNPFGCGGSRLAGVFGVCVSNQSPIDLTGHQVVIQEYKRDEASGHMATKETEFRVVGGFIQGASAHKTYSYQGLQKDKVVDIKYAVNVDGRTACQGIITGPFNSNEQNLFICNYTAE